MLFLRLKNYLTILQLEEYKLSRYWKWIVSHKFAYQISDKKKVVFTSKVRVILFLSAVIFLAVDLLVFYLTESVIILLATIFFLITQPYLLFSIAVLILFPAEKVSALLLKKRIRKTIKEKKKLTVVGVTGSYGKTTTKEILYQLLRNKAKVLRTPESYNTLFGIAKVIDLELDDSYDYFICEMAAYKSNDITELCNTFCPDYGIITGVTRQHLERFGSLKNIIKTKFEVFDFIKDKDKIVFNLGNDFIRKELYDRGVKNAFGYTLKGSNAMVTAENISLGPSGSTLRLKVKNRIYKVRTNLFGYQNVENLLGALSVALVLGFDLKNLLERIKDLKGVPHRFELLSKGESKASIIDNTYSSNERNFVELCRTARKVKGKKVLVTPGLVELGKKEKEVHVELGKMCAKVFDKIVLIGNSSRTKSLSKGIGNIRKVEMIKDTRAEYSKKMSDLSKEYDWIFLENDLSPNY